MTSKSVCDYYHIYNSIYKYDYFITLINKDNVNNLDIDFILQSLLKEYSNNYIIKIITFLIRFDGIIDKINNSKIKIEIINKFIKENNLLSLQQLNNLCIYNEDNNIKCLIKLIEEKHEINKLLEEYLFEDVSHYINISSIIYDFRYKDKEDLCKKIIRNCSLKQLNRCNGDYYYFADDTPEYFQLIHELLSDNRIELIKEVIKKGVDINYITPISKNTILHHMMINSTEGLKLLLPLFKIDINFKNAKGETILYTYTKHAYSYLHCYIKICNYLRSLGADIYTYNNKGKTLLYLMDNMTTNERYYKEALNYLIGNDCKVYKYNNDHTQYIKINKKDDGQLYYEKIKEKSPDEAFIDNNVLLIHSIIHNDKALFRMSVHPSIVNNIDKNGLSPLYYAYINERFELFDLLIQNGADVNITNSLGQNLLYEVKAYYKSDLKKTDKLLKKYKFLINKGINVNFIDNNGDTPILYLAKAQINYKSNFKKFKNTEIIKNKLLLPIIELLIDNGADVNLPDKDGNTILYYFYNNLTFINKLIEYNIDLNHVNSNGENILFYIINKGLPEKIKHITNTITCNDEELETIKTSLPENYEQICKIITCNNRNIIYIKYDPLFIIKYLIIKGVKIDTINNEGDNLLICAAKNKNIEAVNMFLLLGIIKSFVNKEGFTYDYYLN